MLRKLTICALLAGAPLVSHASEPEAPVILNDAARAWTLDLQLTDGLTAREVAVVQVFNRFQGTVIDQNARLAGGFPVRRALPVVDLGRGRVRIDLSPVAAGQRLPDGIYAQYLEIEAQPFAETMEPFQVLHPIYFEVAGGVPTRIDMQRYSERVEPTALLRDKSGIALPVHAGIAGRGAAPLVAGEPDLQVERGDPFARPGDERNQD